MTAPGGLASGRDDPGIAGFYCLYSQPGGSVLQKGGDFFSAQGLEFLYLFRCIGAINQNGVRTVFMLLDELPGIIHGLSSLQQCFGIQFIGGLFLGFVPGDLSQGRLGAASGQQERFSGDEAFRDFCGASQLLGPESCQRLQESASSCEKGEGLKGCGDGAAIFGGFIIGNDIEPSGTGLFCRFFQGK